MELRTGVDILELGQFARNAKSDAFLRKVFTVDERQECEQSANPVEYYARKFALKEAVMKALGHGIRDEVWFTQIEIIKNNVLFARKAREIFNDLGAPALSISLSVEHDLVVAMVVLHE